MEQAFGTILVPPLPAQEGVAPFLPRLAARDRHAELNRVRVAELEEGPEPTREERNPERAPAEGRFVVAVEDAREPLQIEGEIGHDRHLDAPLGETLPAEKVAEHVGPIDPRQIVLVDHVRVAEAVPHLAELGLGAKRQREHGHARLGEVHGGLGASHAFARLDADLGVGVGVDLAEQRQLDLAWEEAVLLSGEGPPPGFLDVRLRDVADEVADDADIEQELTAAALRVERERLARARQVGERG